MTDLYLTVVVEDNFEKSKEVIRYYITKDKSYGFKITITSKDNLNENNVIVMDNLTTDMKEIKELVQLLERSGREFLDVKDIVEDYLKKVELKNA